MLLSRAGVACKGWCSSRSGCSSSRCADAIVFKSTDGARAQVLPYDMRTSQRWLLKLHGDVNHPEVGANPLSDALL